MQIIHSLFTKDTVLEFYAFNGMFVHNDTNIILSNLNPVFWKDSIKIIDLKMFIIHIFYEYDFKHRQYVLECST